MMEEGFYLHAVVYTLHALRLHLQRHSTIYVHWKTLQTA